jgi:hypothetical protein
MDIKRVALFAGHYGSGKTNLAINYALRLRTIVENVAICDLDIVNPYFRTKDSEQLLRQAGIRLISSAYANSNLDVPAIPPETYAIIHERDLYPVVDVGGDDRGALALGRYSPYIREEDDYEMFLVINMFRPLTGTGTNAVDILREIEAASGLPFTAIINNSNLGAETTPEDVLASVGYADEISGLTGLPVRYTSVREDLYPALNGKIRDLFPIKIFGKPQWSV